MRPSNKQRTGTTTQSTASATTPASAAAAPRRAARQSTRARRANATKVVRDATTVVQAAATKRTNPEDNTTKAAYSTKRVVLKGRLQSLPDLALEIQLEIYSYLEPRDLLFLSRTCKKFRSFFLDRQLNERLWERVWANTEGLPARPPFMSLPAFTYLLYSTYCHQCGAPNVRKIMFGFFRRLCKSCSGATNVSHHEAMREADQVDANYRYGLHSSLGFRISSHIAAQDRNTGFRSLTFGSSVPRDALDRFFERFKALPRPLTCKSRYAFFATVKEENRVVTEFACAVRDWCNRLEQQRQASLKDVRRERLEAIVDRLRECGWEKELDFMGATGLDIVSKMPVVRQSSKLTESAWAKIFPSLSRLLNTTREKRLKAEYSAALRKRFEALEQVITAHYVSLPRTARMDCRPQYIDLAFIPEIRAIADVPASEVVTADHFAAVVPAVVAKWEADQRKELTDYILPLLGDISPDVDPLSLAIACFIHRSVRGDHGYGALMRYPDIFARGCARVGGCDRADLAHENPYTRLARTSKWEPRLEGVDVGKHEMMSPLGVSTLAKPAQAKAVVDCLRGIVLALGLDPARATEDDLDAHDVWLHCVTCEARNKPRDAIWVYHWRSAYEHAMMNKYTHDIPGWRRVSEADMAVVHARVQSKQWSHKDSCKALWACSLCMTINARISAMQRHLEQTHGMIYCISRAIEEGTIYLHPSADKTEVTVNTVCLRERRVLA
ncbi:hypothetical protein C8Q77DRAFT_1063124 [Trametes polyzona]|nr:hypothetical protein C8Q77DRAFT_1063124 [Trametes polyzona]